jgi:hypothetical protein
MDNDLSYRKHGKGGTIRRYRSIDGGAMRQPVGHSNPLRIQAGAGFVPARKSNAAPTPTAPARSVTDV